MNKPHVVPSDSEPRQPSRAVELSGGGFMLPQLLTPLFGREQDIRGLAELMRGEDVRLITLSGAPGIGKTRLSIAVSHDWQQRFGNQVHFVQLGSIDDPSLLLPTLAAGFEVQRSRRIPLIDRLAMRLRGSPVLLVLDNFEQILEAAEDVVELLLRCADLKVLVTSRSPLRVRGEYQWEVLPLSLPLLGDMRQPAVFGSYPSVALLLDRAGPRQTTLPLTQENAGLIAAICIRLGGIPLAIELAAPWLRLFSPQELLSRLEQPLELLRGGARDLPGRQQTLENAIAWSDNLLEPHERRLFHRLSVFVDGWTLEAAEKVCVADGEACGSRSVVDGSGGVARKELDLSRGRSRCVTTVFHVGDDSRVRASAPQCRWRCYRGSAASRHILSGVHPRCRTPPVP